MVVHHLDFPLVVLRELDGVAARIAQPARHRNVNDLIASVRENAVPEFHQLPRRRLRRRQLLVLLHDLVQLLMRDVDALQILFSVHDHRHGQKIDPGLLRLPVRHAAVRVGRDRHFHTIPSLIYAWLRIDTRKIHDTIRDKCITLTLSSSIPHPETKRAVVFQVIQKERTRLDKRKEENIRVKVCITQSLFRLMQTKSLSEITVTELVKDAAWPAHPFTGIMIPRRTCSSR